MPRRSLMSRRPTSVRAVAEVGVLVAMLIWAANFTVVKAAVTAWPVLPFFPKGTQIARAGIGTLGAIVTKICGIVIRFG